MKKNIFEPAGVHHRQVTGRYHSKSLERSLASENYRGLIAPFVQTFDLREPAVFFLFTLMIVSTVGTAKSAQVSQGVPAETLTPNEGDSLRSVTSQAAATKTQLEKALMISPSISLAEQQTCFKMIESFATSIHQLNGTQKIVDIALGSGVKIKCLPKKSSLSDYTARVATYNPADRRINLSLFSDVTSEYEKQQVGSILRHEFIHAAYESQKYLSRCKYKSSIVPICLTELALVEKYAQALAAGDKRLLALTQRYEVIKSKVEKGKILSLEEKEIRQSMQEVLADCDFIYFSIKIPTDAGLARKKTFTHPALPGAIFLIESVRQEGQEAHLQLKTASKFDSLKALPYYKDVMAKTYAAGEESARKRVIQTTEAEAYIRQVLGDTAFSKIYSDAWSMLEKDQATWPITLPKPSI
ncbi:MAG: hypothetical protein K0R98_1052 [Rickettsiaceae bacterium]|nr:hypothetical protein [Rickettsiaceae bacterium]